MQQLDAAAVRGPVLINAVVYAEFSVGYLRIEEVDKVLADGGLELAEIPRAALFLAGKVFQRSYRAQGAPAGVFCLISSSVPMRPLWICLCSLMIRAGIGRIFLGSP